MNKKQERELSQWKRRLRWAMKAQEEQGKSKDWEQWEKYYLGDFNAPLSFNYTFALARAKTPQVYFRNPRVVPIARRPDKEAAARVMESVDEYLIQEMGLKAQMKMMVLDNFLYGVAILKLGYDSEFGFQPDQTLGLVETEQGTYDLSAGTLTGYNEQMERIEYNANIRHGMPWVLRVHPKEFLIDPTATSIEEAQWVAHRTLRPLKDIRQDEKYENTSDLKPYYSDHWRALDEARMIRSDKYVPKAADADRMRPQPSTREDIAETFEIRDAKAQRIISISLNHMKFLRHEHDELQIDGLPYVAAVFHRNPRSFWGIPDAQVINPQQLELNEVRLRQQDARRLAVRKFLMREGSMTPEEIEKFLGEQTNPFVMVRNDAEPNLENVIKPINMVMPQDLSLWSNEVVRDMREMVGLGRNQVGEFEPSGRRTATEAGIVQQNAQIRVDESRDMMADALALVMRRVNQIIFKFWTKEQVVRVVGPDGMAYWVNYTGPELQGEYDYKIEPDDALPMSREKRRAEALALYQSLMGNPNINQVELARHLVRQFEGISPDLLINAPQSPQSGPIGVDQFGQVEPQGPQPQQMPAAPGGGNGGQQGADMGLLMQRMQMGG